MQTSRTTTRYADLTRLQAGGVIAFFFIFLAWLLLAAFSTGPVSTIPERGGSDLQLYRNIVQRVHAGESYYDVAGQELRAGGYPTASPLNWRPPIYAWIIGSLPAIGWGKAILGLLCLAALFVTLASLETEWGRPHAVGGALVMIGAFLWCLDGDAFLSQELWAGVLIALSVGSYAIHRRSLGFTCGLAALFFRELSLPYCGVALILAARGKRRLEVLAWTAGFVAYALFLLLHWKAVSLRITPADRPAENWLQFGGAGFLLATCRMNEFFFNLPSWFTAVFLSLSILGLAGWRGETGIRVQFTVVLYLLAFSIVGLPFNNYWGLLYVPLLSFGIIGVPASFRDLRSAIRLPRLACSTPSVPALQ
jgi:hypothetical protein